jgi:hypothetical protein
LATQTIAANLALMLGEIITETVRQGLPKITISTLHEYLELMFAILKGVHVIHAMRNPPKED